MLHTLRFAPGRVWWRELCAHDELSITEIGTAGAIALLDQLMTTGTDGATPPRAADLTTADRDRLLAAVYAHLWGNRIDSTINCVACAEPFDVQFRLDELQAFSQPDPLAAQLLPDGLFRLANGGRFRLPTGADELAVSGLADDVAVGQLLHRCLPDGPATVDAQAVQEAMQAVAPLLDMDLGAQCPECGQVQSVRFSMQSFLLNRLKNEQPQVLADIHRLATTYRWSHGEITRLPRQERRQYARFIQAEQLTANQWLT